MNRDQTASVKRKTRILIFWYGTIEGTNWLHQSSLKDLLIAANSASSACKASPNDIYAWKIGSFYFTNTRWTFAACCLYCTGAASRAESILHPPPASSSGAADSLLLSIITYCSLLMFSWPHLCRNHTWSAVCHVNFWTVSLAGHLLPNELHEPPLFWMLLKFVLWSQHLGLLCAQESSSVWQSDTRAKSTGFYCIKVSWHDQCLASPGRNTTASHRHHMWSRIGMSTGRVRGGYNSYPVNITSTWPDPITRRFKTTVPITGLDSWRV